MSYPSYLPIAPTPFELEPIWEPTQADIEILNATWPEEEAVNIMFYLCNKFTFYMMCQ